MQVRAKVWLESEGGRLVMGEGRLAILEAVDRDGSLSAAARSLGMSYRAVWGKVRELERRLGIPLVRGRSGGSRHGGATLTDEAKRFVAAFRQFDDRAQAAVARLAREAGFGRDPGQDPG